MAKTTMRAIFAIHLDNNEVVKSGETFKVEVSEAERLAKLGAASFVDDVKPSATEDFDDEDGEGADENAEEALKAAVSEKIASFSKEELKAAKAEAKKAGSTLEEFVAESLKA